MKKLLLGLIFLCGVGYAQTWDEEDGSASNMSRNVNEGITFKSSVTLPTTALSIEGAGSGTGLDSDKLDGQHGSYYATTASTNNTVNITNFNSTATIVEQNYTALRSTSASLTTLYENHRATGTIVESNYTALRSTAASLSTLYENHRATGTIVESNYTALRSTSASLTTLYENHRATATVVESNYTALRSTSASLTTLYENHRATGAIVEQNYADLKSTSASLAKLNADVDVSTAALQVEIDGLQGTTQRYYFTTVGAGSDQYYATTATYVTAETNFIKFGVSGSGVIVSSWSLQLAGITEIPAGLWTIEVYATINNTNSTQLYFDVYDGTGDAMVAGNLIAGSNLSGILSTAKTDYIVNLSTKTIVPKSRFLSFVLKANESGANPNITVYCGGSSDGHITLPVTRSEVSVTKIVAGTGISISPTSGIGDVTITAEVTQAELDEVKVSTGLLATTVQLDAVKVSTGLVAFINAHAGANTGDVVAFMGSSIAFKADGGGGAVAGGTTLLSTKTISAQDMICYGLGNGAYPIVTTLETTFRGITSTRPVSRDIEYSNTSNGRADYTYFIPMSSTLNMRTVNYATGTAVGTFWQEVWVTSNTETPATAIYSTAEGTGTPTVTNDFNIDYSITGLQTGTPYIISIIRRIGDSSVQNLYLKTLKIME